MSEALDIIAEVFGAYIDVDNSNDDVTVMRTSSVADAMAALGIVVDAKQQGEIIEALDPDRSGFVNFETFADVMSAKLETTGGQGISNDTIEETFHLFTSTHRITLTDLQRVSKDVKDDATLQQLQEMLEVESGSNGVGIEEFARILSRIGFTNS
jgi:Ca2+-binding EF-hand superfamily protein